MFTALIISVITVSFTQLMIRNSQQALDNDLAQRAYDSAMAGVEDAKRLLIVARDCDAVNTTRDPATCGAYKTAIANKKCSTIQDSGLAASSQSEVQVGNADDNQAYTCVKIETQPDSVHFTVAGDSSATIPLKAADKFQNIYIKWFKKPKNISESGRATCPGGSSDITTTLSSCPTRMTGSIPALPNTATWNSGGTTPPILRVQYIPPSGYPETDGNQKEVATRFLYPSTKLTSSGIGMQPADRQTPFNDVIQEVSCRYSADTGVCEAMLNINETTDGYLQIATIYNSADFEVSLHANSPAGNVVKFDGVQPTVDSTGRADNLYRRVKADVQLSPVAIAYPGAINLRGDLCKAFFVTNNGGDFSEDSPCNGSSSTVK